MSNGQEAEAQAQAPSGGTKVSRQPRPGVDDQDEEPYAGLPTSRAPSTPLQHLLGAGAGPHIDHDYITFTLDPGDLSLAWGNTGRADSHRRFSIIEVTPDMEDKSSNAAGMSQNFGAAYRELMIMSIYRIGDQPTNRNRDVVNKWLNDVGPRARKCVEKAFNKLNGMEEARADTFLESAEAGRG